MRRAFFLIWILIALSMAGCQPKAPAQTPPAELTPLPTRTPSPEAATRAPRPEPTSSPKANPSPAPKVTLRAVKGNLFIRRGPDMAYNPIDVLYKDSAAQVIGHDVLYKWAQVTTPGKDGQGWVSLQTQYSQVEGDLNSVPQISVKDWPQPAYLRNCTYHRMYIEPGNIYLESAYSVENMVWLYPGHYVVYDMDMPDLVEVMDVDMREGVTLDIRNDGAGEKRKCAE